MTISRFEMQAKGAAISSCGQYRMHLIRGADNTPRKMIGWVLNNPSTADHETDDATIKKIWRFTTSWGFYALAVVNTNPFRSTDPNHRHEPSPSVMNLNDDWLRHVQQRCEFIVCGWGDKAMPHFAKRAALVLHEAGPLKALRITKAGNPQHPLYLPESLKPIEWKPTRYLQ